MWTCQISQKKLLKCLVKRDIFTQVEADGFSEKLFEQLDADNILGLKLQHLAKRCTILMLQSTHLSLGLNKSRKRMLPVQAILSKAGCGATPLSSTCECGKRSTTQGFPKLLAMN